MTIIKTTTFRAIDLVQGLGNDKDGVPYRWLTSLVEQVRKLVPDDEEGSCKVHGMENLTFTYEHTLTPLEETQARLDDMYERAAEIRSLLPRSGVMNEEEVKKLRELLG